MKLATVKSTDLLPHYCALVFANILLAAVNAYHGYSWGEFVCMLLAGIIACRTVWLWRDARKP
jgi:hypothetical protein